MVSRSLVSICGYSGVKPADFRHDASKMGVEPTHGNTEKALGIMLLTPESLWEGKAGIVAIHE